jgi:hypothetical protein
MVLVHSTEEVLMVRRGLPFILAALLVLPVARPAQALFHLAVIDEVMTSYGGNATSQFIEIRMLSGAQNLVTDSVFAAFDASGAYIGDVLVVPGNVTNQGAGVRWIVGTAQFQTDSGIMPDFTFAPGVLPTGGGMVCFGGGGGILPAPPGSWSRTVFSNYIDCVAYGTYSGPTNPHIGTPTSLDADGHSLVRTADTNDSLNDFACNDPADPENNAGAVGSMTATAACPPPATTTTTTPTSTTTTTTGPPGIPAISAIGSQLLAGLLALSMGGWALLRRRWRSR